MKAFKKALAYALAATLALGSCTSVFAASSPEQGVKPGTVKEEKKDGVTAKVKVDKDKGVVVKEIKSNKKNVTVPSTIGGLKPTTIGAKTFADAKKATKITLPASIKTIEKNAFKGAEKLKTLRLNISKANKITVKKGAFKGLNTKKMTIKVNKNTSAKALKKIQKAMQKAGFKGKVVKAKK